jgi:carboxyl-terminal processing protease
VGFYSKNFVVNFNVCSGCRVNYRPFSTVTQKRIIGYLYEFFVFPKYYNGVVLFFHRFNFVHFTKYMKETGNWKLYVPIVIGISLGLGYLLGNSTNKTNQAPSVSKVESTNFNMLGELLNYIDAEYVDEVSKDELVDKTVKYLLQELDPHSYYISPDEYAEMNEPLEGNFDGIGIQFNIQNDTLVVIDPIVNGPSEKVGIRAGDRIIKVNDSLIAGVGVRNRTVLKLLKGVKGTKVEVTVSRRGNEPLKFLITRDKIPIHSVSSSYMFNDTTGYIKVDRFGSNTTQEFLNGVSRLENQNAKKVIIDLRGNGGGYMNAATDMLDAFFDKGELLVYTEGKARRKTETMSKTKAHFSAMDVVVLIDESSASASEIFAGAIQDHDRGVIVGRRSFGKGLVQEQTVWPNGSATRLTIARYYTPSGRCIQKPYTNGLKEYQKEYSHRYENGEMLSKDSIEISDSSVFKTDAGRLVFGSGGIIPDVFIPIDTTQGSSYLTELAYSGVIYDFAFDYADHHRKEMSKYKGAEDYIASFEISEELLAELISFAEKKDIVFDEFGFERSKKIILKRLKAYIARNIWNDEGFYPIWNYDDPTIKAAVLSNVQNLIEE